MSYTPIQKGAINWDVPVNAAFTDQDTRIDANGARLTALENPYTSLGILAMPYPTSYAAGATAPSTNGQLYMIRANLNKTAVATGIYLSFSAGMSGAVAGQNFVGLYDSNGNLVAQTADQSTNFTNTDLITCPFTSPVTLSPGSYYITFMFNATTRPTVMRGLSVTTLAESLNVGLTNSNAMWSTTGAGLTALPSSVNMATRSKAGNAWWGAIY